MLREIVDIQFSNDNKVEFIEKYKSLKNFDLLITSGGISKGKYDIVKESLKKSGLKILFERVAIKPGKPTTFCKLGKNKFFLILNYFSFCISACTIGYLKLWKRNFDAIFVFQTSPVLVAIPSTLISFLKKAFISDLYYSYKH